MNISSNSKIFPTLAIVFWCASLVVPAIMFEGQSYFLGWHVLVFGMAFGWLCNGWAVYANLFFLIAFIRLLHHKTPWISSLLMLGLAALLPLFSGAPANEGTDVIDAVVSWGLGAVFWMTAMYFIVAAVIARHLRISVVAGVVTSVAILLLVYVILCVNYLNVRKLANDQEREMYLSKGMMLPVVKMSGVPFKFPRGNPELKNEIVTLKVDAALKSGDENTPKLFIPKIVNYREDGYQWITAPLLGGGSLTLRTKSEDESIILEITKNPPGVLVRIFNVKTNKEFFRQQLRILNRNHSRFYYPLATRNGVEKGYDSAILRVLGRDKNVSAETKSHRVSIEGDFGNISCNVNKFDDANGFSVWDNREVVFEPSLIAKNQGICSERYMYLIGLVWKSTKEAAPFVRVFDRRSLSHVASYGEASFAMIGEHEKNMILSVNVDDDKVTVNTKVGGFSARRLY